MCKHNWQAAVPVDEVPADKRATLVALSIANDSLTRTYYCPLCRATGHSVYGRRIQKHIGAATLLQINDNRQTLGLLPLPLPE